MNKWVMLILILMLIPATYAADPGHNANEISSGTFESGDYTFPSTLYVADSIGINVTSVTAGYRLYVNGNISATAGYFTNLYQNGNAVLDTSGGYITTSNMWNRSGENLFLYDNSNNVGIGTNTPFATLVVNGSVYFAGGSGDVNGLSGVTATDALYVSTYLGGGYNLTPEQYSRADIDGNGQIDKYEAYLIQQIAAGIMTAEEAHIQGKAIRDRSITINNLAFVGIGTGEPSQKLEVAGNVNISGANKLYTPEICLAGDCQTAWPSADFSGYYNNITNFTGTRINGYTCVYNNTSQELDCNVAPVVDTDTNETTRMNIIYTPVTTNRSNWDTAYDWGNHANQGYFTNLTNFTGTLNNTKLCTYNSGTQTLECNTDPTAAGIWTNSSSNATFTSGNVGIGTTTPTTALEVSNGSQSITLDPTVADATINTTGNADLVITSDGGNVIIKLG